MFFEARLFDRFFFFFADTGLVNGFCFKFTLKCFKISWRSARPRGLVISEEAGETVFYVKYSDGWLVITGIKLSTEAAFSSSFPVLSVIISTRSLLNLLTLTCLTSMSKVWISDFSWELSREVRGGAAISF